MLTYDTDRRTDRRTVNLTYLHTYMHACMHVHTHTHAHTPTGTEAHRHTGKSKRAQTHLHTYDMSAESSNYAGLSAELMSAGRAFTQLLVWALEFRVLDTRIRSKMSRIGSSDEAEPFKPSFIKCLRVIARIFLHSGLQFNRFGANNNKNVERRGSQERMQHCLPKHRVRRTEP